MVDSTQSILLTLETILYKLEEIERRIDLIDSKIKSYQQNAVSSDSIPDAFVHNVETDNQEPTVQLEEDISIETEVEDTFPEANTEATPNVEAVIDRMKPQIPSWKTDMPGMKVNDINDAISLNDRIFFVTELFSGDSDLFKKTILAANHSDNFEHFESYICENFPDWDMESEAVYRLMMLVRRKLS